jgi:hypothetical protein
MRIGHLKRGPTPGEQADRGHECHIDLAQLFHLQTEGLGDIAAHPHSLGDRACAS